MVKSLTQLSSLWPTANKILRIHDNTKDGDPPMATLFAVSSQREEGGSIDKERFNSICRLVAACPLCTCNKYFARVNLVAVVPTPVSFRDVKTYTAFLQLLSILEHESTLQSVLQYCMVLCIPQTFFGPRKACFNLLTAICAILPIRLRQPVCFLDRFSEVNTAVTHHMLTARCYVVCKSD